jgi:hypothetical protein
MIGNKLEKKNKVPKKDKKERHKEAQKKYKANLNEDKKKQVQEQDKIQHANKRKAEANLERYNDIMNLDTKEIDSSE